MSRLTNCPNCGAKWSHEEQETDSCDSCNYVDLIGPGHFEFMSLDEATRKFEGSESAPLKMDEVGLLTKPCSGNCGMNYCDDNGCLEKKHILDDGPIPLKHKDDENRN